MYVLAQHIIPLSLTCSTHMYGNEIHISFKIYTSHGLFQNLAPGGQMLRVQILGGGGGGGGKYYYTTVLISHFNTYRINSNSSNAYRIIANSSRPRIVAVVNYSRSQKTVTFSFRSV